MNRSGIKPISRSKRSWKAAREKVEQEGACRACGRVRDLQAAHVIPRSRVPGPEAMDPLNVVALCQGCHADQHQGKLELLPLLSLAEQSYVAGLVGLAEAYRRTTVAGRVTGKAA